MAFENGTEGNKAVASSKKPVEQIGRRLIGIEAVNLAEFERLKKADPQTILESSDFVSH